MLLFTAHSIPTSMAAESPYVAQLEETVRRGARPVRLVRLHQAPFTDRLVAKFDLPVSGWRGAAERRRNRDNGGDSA